MVFLQREYSELLSWGTWTGSILAGSASLVPSVLWEQLWSIFETNIKDTKRGEIVMESKSWWEHWGTKAEFIVMSSGTLWPHQYEKHLAVYRWGHENRVKVSRINRFYFHSERVQRWKAQEMWVTWIAKWTSICCQIYSHAQDIRAQPSFSCWQVLLFLV